jgi:hypothetical protein
MAVPSVRRPNRLTVAPTTGRPATSMSRTVYDADCPAVGRGGSEATSTRTLRGRAHGWGTSAGRRGGSWVSRGSLTLGATLGPTLAGVERLATGAGVGAGNADGDDNRADDGAGAMDDGVDDDGADARVDDDTAGGGDERVDDGAAGAGGAGGAAGDGAVSGALTAGRPRSDVESRSTDSTAVNRFSRRLSC